MEKRDDTTLVPDSAEEAQRKALVALEARAHALLSKQLWTSSAFDEAEAELAQAIALSPDDGWRLRQAIFLPYVAESRQQIDKLRARMEARLLALASEDLLIPDPVKQIDWTCFLLAYHGEHNNAHLHRLFHRLCSKACPDLDWQSPFCAAPRSPGRPRIGFVSWYFSDHTISRLFTGLIERLDRESFDVSVFAIEGNDAFLRQADMGGKQIVALPTTLADARSTISNAQLDILIYLDLGMDPFTLYLAHARLARTQAVLWGHPDTTGVSNIDVFLSSDAMEPTGGESHYDERLVRLPGIGSWFRRPEIPPVVPTAADYGLPEGALIYLCPQTPQKFHPDFDAVIRRILTAQPNAHLVLTAGWARKAMDAVCRRILGPTPELSSRLHILGPMDRPRFIGLMRLADLLLDPPHYSGGHTTLEAFACGAPVITWPGRHMRARHSYGLYRLIGIMDCVAADLDAYVDLAISLGKDRKKRDALRQRIIENSAVLYEDEMAVRAFEAFLWSEMSGPVIAP
jgi:predicted O-linked N-acetylglucosamine transferase (SPINDLY family)